MPAEVRAKLAAPMRELVKYLTGWPFEIVDAIISNTRRLNGLEPTVERYD